MHLIDDPKWRYVQTYGDSWSHVLHSNHYFPAPIRSGMQDWLRFHFGEEGAQYRFIAWTGSPGDRDRLVTVYSHIPEVITLFKMQFA